MRGSYGIDAPYVPFGWLIGGAACWVGAGFGFAGAGRRAGLLPLVIGIVLVAGAVVYLYTTRRGSSCCGNGFWPTWGWPETSGWWIWDAAGGPCC